MKIALAILAAAVLIIGFIWYRNQQELDAMRRHQAAYEARTSYSASAFPVTVTFPRGGVMPVDYWGEMNWKDHPWSKSIWAFCLESRPSPVTMRFMCFVKRPPTRKAGGSGSRLWRHRTERWRIRPKSARP